MNFDCYAITTWPGYCFQTALCIRSILKHFPPRPIHIIVDTEHHTGNPIATPWPDFESDLKKYISEQHFKAKIVWHTVEQVPAINQCPVGWWRQQLVKLCLDQYLPGNSWLVIDADIIFGHWAALQGQCPNRKIHAIDTGCVWGGALTALRLQDMRRFSVPGQSVLR